MKDTLNALINKLEVAPISESDLWLIGILAALVLAVVMLRFMLFIHDFSEELCYLNMEIARSEGAERSYYVHERRRLWLSLIPFIKY